MASEIEKLNNQLERLIAALAPVGKFADQWTLKEIRPGEYSKLPMAEPFRPEPNSCLIIAIGVADAFGAQFRGGYYHIIATADCFMALNTMARTDGGYPLLAGAIYGPVRLTVQDVLHVIGTVAGGNVYICPVE